MQTVLVPTFDEFNKYSFIGYVEIKIKNNPDWKDLNKVTKPLPGIPMGACGRKPLNTLITKGRQQVTDFYDLRQNTKKLKGYYITLKK